MTSYIKAVTKYARRSVYKLMLLFYYFMIDTSNSATCINIDNSQMVRNLWNIHCSCEECLWWPDKRLRARFVFPA
jgi:hypothetical protein